MKKVLIISLGGTIAMVDRDGDGALPTLNAADLVASVPGLSAVAAIEAESLCCIASANLDIDHVRAVIARAEQAEKQGFAGVVVTQGTDTLEETSFAASLLWNGALPIIFTGAMRHQENAGADGPANLLAAVRVAGSEASHGRGVVVVMNDEIHDPLWVRKSHTTSVAAFASSTVGSMGRVHEGAVEYFRTLERKVHVAIPASAPPVRVPLITTFLGDDGAVLDAVAAKGCDGLVFAAFGGGHVSEQVAERLGALAIRIPVVFASKAGAGRVLTATYGYPGSERDLIARGCIPAGQLDGSKARILLQMLLMAGRGRDEIESSIGIF